MSQEYVWVRQNSGQGVSVVHTSPDCQAFKGGRNPRKVRRERFSDKRLCSYCSGEWESVERTEQKKSLRQAIADGEVEI